MPRQQTSKKLKKSKEDRSVVELRYKIIVTVTTKSSGKPAKKEFVQELVRDALKCDFEDAVFPDGTFEVGDVTVIRKLISETPSDGAQQKPGIDVHKLLLGTKEEVKE